MEEEIDRKATDQWDRRGKAGGVAGRLSFFDHSNPAIHTFCYELRPEALLHLAIASDL